MNPFLILGLSIAWITAICCVLLAYFDESVRVSCMFFAAIATIIAALLTVHSAIQWASIHP